MTVVVIHQNPYLFHLSLPGVGTERYVYGKESSYLLKGSVEIAASSTLGINRLCYQVHERPTLL